MWLFGRLLKSINWCRALDKECTYFFAKGIGRLIYASNWAKLIPMKLSDWYLNGGYATFFYLLLFFVANFLGTVYPTSFRWLK